MNQYVYNARMAKEDNLPSPDPTQELVVWSCKCGGVAATGDFAVSHRRGCRAKPERIPVIPLSTHQALEARVRELERVLKLIRGDGTTPQWMIGHIDHALSAFNNQPTGTEGGADG